MFIEHLDRYASTGDEFPLNKLTINLTFDIIGAVTMGVDFDAQHSESSKQGNFIRLYDQLLKLYGSDDDQLPWFLFPRREWRRYRLSTQIDSHLEAMILEKHAEQRQGGGAGSRSVLSLCLQGSDVLTKDLLHETRDQIKTFLFAGHDTTGILLAWLFYELSRSPQALKAVRDELDELFGPDPDPRVVRQKLLAPKGGELIHRMPYITAVIKEVLRLYPPAGTARMAPPGTGFTVRTPDSQTYCLDGMIIYNCATIIQRDRSVFGDSANDFVPERWLGDKSGIMSAGAQDEKDQANGPGSTFPAGAWRPFERGPRNCIGQDLATIEARVIVAAVARRYDFVKVGLGELDRDEKGEPVVNETGQFKTKSKLYNVSAPSSFEIDRC
jgi:cytochrome P450